MTERGPASLPSSRPSWNWGAWSTLRCFRDPCRREVRLWLSLIAHNLGNLWPGRPRGRVSPKRIDNWSPTSLRQRLVRTGGRLVKHARYYRLMLAESHLARRLFGSMARRIAVLPVPSGKGPAARRQTGRRREGTERCAYSEEPELPLPGPLESLGVEKNESNGSNARRSDV